MDTSRKYLVDEIVRQHFIEGDKETISASAVGRYVSSPFALYCDYFAPEQERDADSEPLAMQKARGIAYEEEVIEGEVVPVPYETPEEGFRLTVEMMAAGEPMILQGLLISNALGMIGRPDQILKVRNSKSIFGNYRYRSGSEACIQYHTCTHDTGCVLQSIAGSHPMSNSEDVHDNQWQER